MFSRRNFIRNTALGMAGVTAVPHLAYAGPAGSLQQAGSKLLPVGIAGYTFAKLSLEASIAMMQKLDLHYLSVKDIHLPLNSTEEKITTTLTQLHNAGIQVYTVGVIYMKTREAVDEAFAYAKKCGVGMIVGVPGYDLLDYAEQQVKNYNIKLAIHNHGPEDALYPGPKDVHDRISRRDSRMGLCLDIGHATRAGAQPDKAVLEYGPRIFDLHIKDVTAAEKNGKAIEIGRGVINFPALVKALHTIQYKGVCSIEFEKDMTDPLAGLAESTGFFRGVLKTEKG
jgi:sugar phosphate isomerase/epimerase